MHGSVSVKGNDYLYSLLSQKTTSMGATSNIIYVRYNPSRPSSTLEHPQ